ncbi:hypothetical protein DV495_001459 [Geotrichum candidum]|nr:hypothetical protein DV452_001014 [Geotrichum candidum]KAF5132259.1 hypothetical protein DV495_001459 [Geotrichum candidum]KAI9213858.1 hypothetical protein DS838_001287 [Geotrichum bryndzae]
MSAGIEEVSATNNAAAGSSNGFNKKRRASQSSLPGAEVKKQKKPKKPRYPSLSYVPKNVKVKLHVRDLRDLVLYTVADGRAPTWLAIENRTSIKHLVTVMVPSLYPSDFGLKDTSQFQPVPYHLEDDTELTFFKSKFDHIWPVMAPGTVAALHSPFDDFVEVPLSKEEKKARAQQQKAQKNKKLDPIDCILDLVQMANNNYPIHPLTDKLPPDHITELLPGWVDTAASESKNSKRKVFGLDCEMCEAASGKVVTRITLVSNHDRKTIYDELVKPEEPIIDYLTRYSGITEEMLKDVTKNLAEAQEELLKLISANDILVGHSLESDLNVLKIRHPLVIDTALLYGAKDTRWKPALRNITQRFVGREIQTGKNGHNSEEDAIACLDLLNLKLLHGLDYGVKNDTKNIAERLATSAQGKRTTAVIDYNTNRWVSTPATLVSCKSDDEIVEKASKLCKTVHFTWTKLAEVNSIRHTPTFGKAGEAQPEGDNSEATQQEKLKAAFKNLNTRLERLYESLPNQTLLVVWTGHGNQKRMRELHTKKRNFQLEYNTKKWNEVTSSWTDKDNQELLRATVNARFGAAFIALKSERPTDSSQPATTDTSAEASGDQEAQETENKQDNEK